MRISGILFGFLLAIGLAYWHDHMGPATSGDGSVRTLVNWEVFGRLVGDFGDWLKDQIDRLVALIGWRE